MECPYVFIFCGWGLVHGLVVIKEKNLLVMKKTPFYILQIKNANHG